MALESATYISQLVTTNPAHTDGLNQTDSHLRLLKTVLQATLPNITGAVTASHTDLNTTTGLAATVTALSAAALRNSGAQVLAGSLTTTGITGGFVNTGSVQQNGNALIPAGIIAMWAGLTTNVPAGWHLCDGTVGTPNLIGMFIVGAGPTGGGGPAAGQTGGTNVQTLTVSTAGAHSHGGVTGLSGAHGHPGSFTDAQGAHSHTGNTGAFALTINEMPTHGHGVGTQAIIGSAGGNSMGVGGSFGGVTHVMEGNGAAHSHGISSDGNHAHNASIAGSPDHSHSIGTDGTHSHTVSVDVRPTYWALCLIMKT
jgi:hypothetical protein